MVEIGSGAQRALKTVMMSRYACYLVIQNADPAKEIVAQGQAVATHTPATGTASSGPGQGGMVTATMLTPSLSAARN